jgi:hypothetical protein
MIRHLSMIAVLIAAAVVAVSPAPAQPPPISNRELRTESPALADRRLETLFWSMLRHDDFRSPRPAQSVLRKLWFRTTPVMTSVPNLCRYDQIVLEFAPTEAGPSDADTPTRPVGLTVDHLFRFLEPPPLDSSPPDDVVVRTGGRCAGLDTRNDPGFFFAHDERLARGGTVAWLKLRRALLAKQPVPMQCELHINDTKPCTDIVLALPEDGPDMISECTSSLDSDCFEILSGDRQMRIVVDRSGPNPGAIRSASLESLITIADSYID